MPVEVRSRDDRIFGGGKKEKKKEPQPSVELQDKMSELDPSVSTAADYKAVGNALVQSGIFTMAIKFYTSAIERDPSNEVLFSNRSAAYLQSTLLSGPSFALKDANRAIDAKPDWFKGYLRKGDALFVVEKYEEAIAAYEECLKLNAGCDSAADSLRQCRAALLTSDEPPTAVPLDAQESSDYHPKTSPHKNPPTQPKMSASEKKEVQESLDAETLLQSWSKDTDVKGGLTGVKPRSVDLTSVKTGEGSATKNAWLSSFRKKVDSDETKAAELRARQDQNQLAGSTYDYKTKTGGGRYDLEKGTDAVGRAITADAYAHEKGEDRKWGY